MSSAAYFSSLNFYTISNLIVSSVKKEGPININEKEAEAWFRIASGRYYCAVFLLFRDAFLEDPDLRLLINHNGSDHGTIQRVLDKRLPKELFHFACMVRELRYLRITADYNTDSGSEIKLADIEACRDYVEKIQDNLDLIMKKMR